MNRVDPPPRLVLFRSCFLVTSLLALVFCFLLFRPSTDFQAGRQDQLASQPALQRAVQDLWVELDRLERLLQETHSGVAKDPREPLLPGEKFFPSHRKLLEKTGWFTYVDWAIEQVRYWPQETVNGKEGIIGLSSFSNGNRVADVAVKGRDDISVVGTLVHKAGHLEGVAKHGTTFSEDWARETERKFYRQLAQHVAQLSSSQSTVRKTDVERRGQLYKWRDEHGNDVFSSNPPNR